MLNAVLFVLMGLELVVIGFSPFYLGLALLVRYVALALPTRLLGLSWKLSSCMLLILSWGGLRGDISLALALGLPDELHPEVSTPTAHPMWYCAATLPLMNNPSSLLVIMAWAWTYATRAPLFFSYSGGSTLTLRTLG